METLIGWAFVFGMIVTWTFVRSVMIEERERQWRDGE